MKRLPFLLIACTGLWPSPMARAQALPGRPSDQATPVSMIPFPRREMDLLASFDDLLPEGPKPGNRNFHAIPPRPPDAPTGSEFIAETSSLSKDAREYAILQQILRGNVPSFLRHTVPVQVSSQDLLGERHAGVVWVLPDYLAIGSDRDFVRIPMRLGTAIKIAAAFGMVLPTRKIVDAIFEQADVRLEPDPLPAGPPMETNAFYLKHQRMIEAKLAPGSHGSLIAGIKKDLVTCLAGSVYPLRLMIYGWHHPDGNPIQPLSGAHLINYADYSHGIRLVSPSATLDGRPIRLSKALAAPVVAPVFSYQPNPWFSEVMTAPPLPYHQ